MPTCFITLSEAVPKLDDADLVAIRDAVAAGLNSGARFLDREHIVVRTQRSLRSHMLGDIELEIFAQFFVRRFFSRDRRAKEISSAICRRLGVGCATWINMSVVGYARATPDGRFFFSD